MSTWLSSIAFVMVLGVASLLVMPPLGAFILGFVTPVLVVAGLPFAIAWSLYVWIRYPEK